MKSEVNLKRVLTRTDLLCHAIGTVTGAGIFSTLPIAIGMTGRSAALAFILAAAIIIVSLVPKILVNGSVRLNGGTYAHLGMFGYKKLAGTFIIISIIANISISWYALSFAQYFSSLIPGINLKVAAGVCLTIFTITNLVGIKEASKVQNLMVLTLGISMSLFCFFGFFHIDSNFFNPKEFMTNGPMGVLTAAGILTFSILGAGLVAAPSPGSIFALMALAPKGGLLPVLAGVAVATVVSFLVAAPFVKRASANESEEDSTSLEEAKAKMSDMKSASKNSEKNIEKKQLEVNEIKKIVFACDAGMGSSAMGASRFKNRIKNLDLDIEITNSSVDNLPDDTQIVVTHNTLVERVAKNNSSVEIVSINNFLNDPNLDTLFKRLESK